MRSYEWGKDECLTLLTDLRDVYMPPNSTDEDYELNQLVLIQEKRTDEGTFYDVHDGQQRLVTLCLLFSALRDRLHEFANALNDERLKKHAENIHNFLKPDDPNNKYSRINRIQK